MAQRGITWTLFLIALIGGACWIASMLVLGLVSERQGRLAEAKHELAQSWGKEQSLVGPFLMFPSPDPEKIPETYVLPRTLSVKGTITPEVRSRGIFDIPVYTSMLQVSGTFSRSDLMQARAFGKQATLVVLLTDTRGIETAIPLSWNGAQLLFVPGPGVAVRDGSGFHADVPVSAGEEIPFSFSFTIQGSDGLAVAPIGGASTITLSAPWANPKFFGEFLPKTRTITETEFTAAWNVSEFGRSYPGSWKGEEVTFDRLHASASGVSLYDALDPYDPVVRSIKYAILFIVVTFAAFFLFHVLSSVRIHPLSYVLVGAALALFSLLLLSFAEYLGFSLAYLIGATMTVMLIGGYASAILGSLRRSIPITSLLVLLYGYLYFVLRLEDYALLFGAILLFFFLAVLMYVTRRIDWFALDR